ncbi:hypothetical protein SEA_CUCURBITA_172 [Gordonia phage Cucurbita]|uniref:Uncharacterized protein n=1 Tax=Gordonia phage ClubL TaxID=1838065 RepID=A0A160DFB1_9CAUD|nr:hypothetical protein BH768_gp034 [Gordonia phage ClubL]YP_009281326.1 hypothetical protein BIZ74_gp033 [Gordonia phage Cucurbita]AUE23555.1 hypothetical protein SEA_TONIANN_173 [Gordonia phage Toniann]QYC53654.1 hypothetical protein SEA_NORVS_170 [Gordonia phage Norvs]ANA86670.1 hypothetical protein PBI_CLUBL_173 [Gordonia phage ClubL]AOE44255.1 hypothetical protein SEA_CUCURBITA_172 [Gordonia phage Cucurbita]
MSYVVTWNIDNDDAGSPIDAATSALGVLRRTYMGDPDGANVFEVLDTETGKKFRVDLGAFETEEIR